VKAGFFCAAVLAGSAWAFQPVKIEVASVKPGDPGATSMGNHFSPGRFTLTNYSLMSLIEWAYRLKEYQIVDAPGWLRSERWTVDGSLTAPVSFMQNMDVLQPLLAERFHLGIRRETRTTNVYSLVIAKGGPKLTPAVDDDKPGWSRYGNQISGHKFDIRGLAPNLSGNLNMPVTDKTGLTGLYDIDLKWTPDPSRPDFGDVHNPADQPAPDPNRPEIFTAIREQLGLELKAEKGPIDVLVIEQVERPSAN
jgi:uncharacterized protein (TIGR03435 family)